MLVAPPPHALDQASQGGAVWEGLRAEAHAALRLSIAGACWQEFAPFLCESMQAEGGAAAGVAQ